MSILASGAADPQVGPGRLVGLIVGVAVCFVIWRYDQWREQKKSAGAPSPTDMPALPAPRDSQVKPVSSHVSPDETPEPSHEGHWFGSITRDARGIGRRVYQNARHIAATGESLDPDAVPDDEPVDSSEFDLALDEAPEPVPDDEPVNAPVAAAQETREQYARRCYAGGAEKAAIVAALQEHYGLSRPTAYRVALATEPRDAP